MKSFLAFLLLALVVVSPSFARVVEDSRSRFILEDVVLESTVHACDSLDSRGGKFVPEGAAYLDGNLMPFRYYRVALPTKDRPEVSVKDISTVALGKPLCKEGPMGTTDSLRFVPVDVSTPFFRDGLWMTDIRVPLYVRNGSSVSLRKKFKVSVTFQGSANGVNPGKRAVSRVLNERGASRFGVSRSGAMKALRKEASSSAADVNFIASIQVGDKNVATFSEDGLYAVDFKTIRNALLLLQRQSDLDGIPVERLCVYGASPDTLSDMGPGEEARLPNHVFEIPIEVRDHTPGSNSSSPDGIFNDGDTLVFVGYGNAFWKRCDREDKFFLNGKMDYFHSYSPYSFYQNFLFGYKDTGKGLRLSDMVKTPSGQGKDVKWMRYVRAEKEALLRDSYFGKSLDWETSTGKEWFWMWHCRFDSITVSVNMTETSRLPGLVSGGKEYVAISYFPYRSIFSGTAVQVNDQVKKMDFSGFDYEARMDQIRFSFDVNGNTVDRLDMTLMPGGNFRMDSPGLAESGNQYTLTMLPNALQYDRFDGYTVAYQWTPVVDSAEWLLPGSVSGVINVPAPSGTRIMKFVDLRPVGLLSVSGGVAKDSVSANEDVRYLAVREGAYRSGLKVEALPFRNDGVLKDLSRPNSKLEYLIIAPDEFLEPAVALASFRSGGSSVQSFATSVVSAQDIYRSYTAGRVSPVAIRNYISYVYSVCPNLQYVLLAGGGHYDYRGITGRLGTSYLPPFEKEDAVVEDFFGILDSGEVCQYGKYDLDLAVGRLPVNSVTEFAQYIKKAKDYDSVGVMDYSDWRSSLLFAADDAVNSGHTDGEPHTRYQETVARMIDSLSVDRGYRWNMRKVYLLDYVEDAAGQKKDAAEALLDFLNQGALFSVYFGHGSKTDWASEGLLKPSYLSKIYNEGRYTILGSFSCTVGRFDEGISRSLSEEFLLAPSAGSINSVGASRETFATYNVAFGTQLLEEALLNEAGTIGLAFLNAKRNTTGLEYNRQRYNNERYVLLGEPVVSMPKSELKVTLDTPLDTIKALDKMHLSGTVSDMDDGYIDLVLREGRIEKVLDLQVISDKTGENDSMNIFYDGPLVYSEKVPVKSGRFETEFVTPRKISSGDTAAEFSAWAYSSNKGVVGRLWQRNLNIGGLSEFASELHDTVPPAIQIQSCYLGNNVTSFADGETVKLQTPACLQVIIEDSTALDFREQADEGISFEVVGVQDPFHPWPYLEQNSKRAKLRMNFTSEQYPAGTYVFRVRAMDVLDNVQIKTVNVEITDNLDAGLADVFNAPNPMGKKGTTFYFKNLVMDSELSKVNIFIYNQNGKLVKVLKDAVSGVTHWDGRDNHGRPLANGLYHYVVRSEVSSKAKSGKKTWTKKQKLLISR